MQEMEEFVWAHASNGHEPKDLCIQQAAVEVWSKETAKNFGFVDLLPEISGEGALYHIAVGKNEAGELVGAYLLDTSPVVIREGGSLNALDFHVRAQSIFGLVKS